MQIGNDLLMKFNIKWSSGFVSGVLPKKQGKKETLMA